MEVLIMRMLGNAAVVTGGSSGIGLESARLLIKEGANVVILARDQRRLADAVSELGSRANGIAVDVSKPQEIERAMLEAHRCLGRIDVLFVNAGVSEAPAMDGITESGYDAFMAINVKGAVFSVSSALPLLNEGARIILTGSVAARRGWPGDPLYAASKGALRSFGRALAVNEAVLSRSIRVNVLSPGATNTPLTKTATSDPVIAQHVAEMIPMKRWGDAREIAEAVLFLASNASSYITGAEITVDGGLAHV